MAGVKGMRGTGSKPGERRGGRQKGTPNKVQKVRTFREALAAHGCVIEEQIASMLADRTIHPEHRARLITMVLPYLLPPLKAVDPAGHLTVAQATALLEALATHFRQVLQRYVSDPVVVTAILAEARHEFSGSPGTQALLLPATAP